jgi:hypothetical protein
MVRGPRPHAADEAGMSLVEVIIYSAVAALVLTALGGLFYAGLKVQAALSGTDAATGAAEVASKSLQAGVRNASNIWVSEATTLLKARVAVGASGWQCVAWKLTADKKLVYKVAEPGVAITDTAYATWPILAKGLGPGATFFSSAPPSAGPSDGASTQVSYSLAFTSGGITVPVVGVATANSYGPGSPASC